MLESTPVERHATENWLYEDFTLGEKSRSIRRTISEGEAMLFNAMVLDMHPYVADEIFAKEQDLFGRCLVWPGRWCSAWGWA